jgi:hypothetical protein
MTATTEKPRVELSTSLEVYRVFGFFHSSLTLAQYLHTSIPSAVWKGGKAWSSARSVWAPFATA